MKKLTTCRQCLAGACCFLVEYNAQNNHGGVYLLTGAPCCRLATTSAVASRKCPSVTCTCASRNTSKTRSWWRGSRRLAPSSKYASTFSPTIHRVTLFYCLIFPGQQTVDPRVRRRDLLLPVEHRPTEGGESVAGGAGRSRGVAASSWRAGGESDCAVRRELQPDGHEFRRQLCCALSRNFQIFLQIVPPSCWFLNDCISLQDSTHDSFGTPDPEKPKSRRRSVRVIIKLLINFAIKYY